MLVSVCFFFKQKTAYEMRISDWSSDVCSSDLIGPLRNKVADSPRPDFRKPRRLYARSTTVWKCSFAEVLLGRSSESTGQDFGMEIGRASCRERVCQYV